MKKSKPKKPAISIRGETYAKLKKEADRRGIAVTELVEEIISNSWAQQEVAKR